MYKLVNKGEKQQCCKVSFSSQPPNNSVTTQQKGNEVDV